MPTFDWTERKAKAAILVAADTLTDIQIAAECSVAKRTLESWKGRTEFRARVADEIAKLTESVREATIADKQCRIDALNSRWRKAQQVIDERASDDEVAHVPGGTTGLIVKNVKGIGKGDDYQIVDVFEVDTGLLAELRGMEMQAAKELGQITEKRDVTTAGKPIGEPRPDLSALTDEELDLYEQLRAKCEPKP